MPNVSLCVTENEIHYNPIVKETKLVVYYDIQDISAPTTIFKNNDNSVKSIEIDGVLLDGVATTYQFDSVGEHIIKYEFNNPTTVGNSAPLFNGLTTIKRAVIPNTFTTIGQNAFTNCGGLASVTIPDSVTTIGNYAFTACISLTSVTIPDSVTSIGVRAFYYCENLSTITSHIMNAPSVNNSTFQGVKNGGKLYVPTGSSGYETWMNDQGNLGSFGWTKVEQ